MTWLRFIGQAGFGATRPSTPRAAATLIWSDDELCACAAQHGWPEAAGLRCRGPSPPELSSVGAVLTDRAARARAVRRRWPGARIRLYVREVECNRAAVAMSAAGVAAREVRRRWRAAATRELAGLYAADQLTLPSQAHGDELLELWPELRSRIVIGTSPSGARAGQRDVPPAWINELRRTLRLPAPALLVADVHRSEPASGGDHIIRAAASAGSRVHVLLGHGSERRRLTCLSERLGIPDRVHWSDAAPEVRIGAADAAVSAALYDMRAGELLRAEAQDRPLLVPRHAPPDVYCGWPVGRGGQRTRIYERRSPEALAVLLREMSERRGSAGPRITARPAAPHPPPRLHPISAVPA